jgi:CheY-like chemotaxis protein
VLIVEDDPDTRGALVAILETEGYAVAEAQHGLDALQQLRTLRDVGLIVLDLFMPKLNGLGFRQEQMKDPALSAIPVVVISADPIAARKAANLGVTATMTKPINFDLLLQLVAQYC